MESTKPRVTVVLECPLSKRPAAVDFDVNVFRMPGQGGLEVAACTECGGGPITCSMSCVHTREAAEARELQHQIHLSELSMIGSNVLG